MKKQLSSSRMLLGISLSASTFLAITVSSAAYSQAYGDCFTSSSGDYFGDCFSSRGDQFASTGYCPIASGSNYSKNDIADPNSAFEENEQIDPNLFTWSDDPRDAFAAPMTDNLQKLPLYKGSMKTFSFVTVSDGKQIESPYKKSFEPPKASKPPKWSFGFWSMGGPGGPVSGDSYTDKFGYTTHLYGWPVNRQLVKVYFAGDVGEARDGLIKRVFVECMRQWCSATRGHLKFTIIEDSRSADIILCRDLTTNYELAENNPTFHNAWLDRVKIKLIDSTIDKIGEAQLRAVLLHSAGHAIGYFGHTQDKNSAMNEECSHIYNPTQKLCPCDVAYIREMYDSYKRHHEGYNGYTSGFARAPYGKPLPIPSMAFMPLPGRLPCPQRVLKPMVPATQRLSLNPAAPKQLSAQKAVARALPGLPRNQIAPTSPRLSFKP